MKEAIYQKLSFANGIIQLPHPDTITQWELDPVYLPTVSGNDVDSYFQQENSNLNLNPSSCKAIKLGKGLALSGHVQEILYAGIEASVPYCFVKSRCVRQTFLRENPYHLWVIIKKDSGLVCEGYCSCVGGITGTCKHVAALLYCLVDIAVQGKNLACTSKKTSVGKIEKVS